MWIIFNEIEAIMSMIFHDTILKIIIFNMIKYWLLKDFIIEQDTIIYIYIYNVIIFK